ncbi:isochorismatase family cysteine hydrolase [Lentibacillus jeotgali]|uniref:isochorismatase family cysteine hydrolase n=1 Tax=Lentibacillus jeotgali TaxID=558169 RepID=UPI00026273FC|nr:isochorismatase family cysteine hydrolase [Lentibacillus jeotgali]
MSSLKFTLENIDKVIDRSFMASPEIDPKRTTLLVLDMQPMCNNPDGGLYIPSVGGAPSGQDVIKPVEKVLEQFRKAGSQVVFSQWGLRPDGLDKGICALKWPPLNPGTPESPASWGNPQTDSFSGNLQPREGEPTVRRSRFSAFQSTPLGEFMRENNSDTLVIAGISTANCVITTTIDAWNQNYKVVVIADGAAAVPSSHTLDVPEGYGQHWEFLRNIQMNYGDVITSDECFERLEASKSKYQKA